MERPHQSLPPPTPVSRAVITCWVISTLTTLLSEITALVLTIVFASGVVPSDALRALAVLVVLTSLCSGTLGLVFLPLAVRTAQARIPRVAIVGALMICALPWLFYLPALFKV